MVPYRSSSHAGFTLIELLVATGIIAVLMTVVIVAVNPFRMFAAAQQTKRSSDVSTLGKSLDTYLISVKGVVPTQMYPLNTPKPIAKNSGGPEADLCGLLSPHIAGLPIDPNSPGNIVKDCASTYSTGYSAVANSSGKIGVYSPTGISLANASGVNVAVYGQVADEYITPALPAMTFGGGTFTPVIAKRTPPTGPFTAGVMVQGNADASGTVDAITVTNSTQINGHFYTFADGDQGSVVFWVTPEWSGSDGLRHVFFTDSSSIIRIEKDASNNLLLKSNGNTLVSMSISSWAAGTTYSVVARWDSKNPIGGTNYASISINGTHTFGTTSTWATLVPSQLNIGSDQTNAKPANALIQGLTIYRRPLYEATTPSGINVGNGDEVSQIYNSGTGKDPTLVTGSWDVVFALPTNSTVGALGTTGEAWSHPHASNLLYTNTTNTGGYMMNGTYTSDGWSAQNAGGSAVTVAALATGSKIFSGGYSVASAGTANQGISYTTASLASGANYVIRAIGNSDSTCNPIIKVFRADGTTLVTSLAGTTTSTRTAPTVYIFTWQTPAAETEQIHLLNTATTGTCSWHQVEVQTNMTPNPSLEGIYAGSPLSPPLWSSWSFATGTTQESTIVHSGSSSMKWDLSTSTGNKQYAKNLTAGAFYSLTGYYYGDGSTSDYLGLHPWNAQSNSGSATTQVTMNKTAVWKPGFVVNRAVRTENSQFNLSTSAASGTRYWDDISQIPLSDVILTLTPASLANSTEASGIRVDGADTLTQNVYNLTATAGQISFNFTPRHSWSTSTKFGFSTPTIFTAYTGSGATLRYLSLFENGFLRLQWYDASVGALNADLSSPTLNAGTTYTFKLTYDSGGNLTMYINGSQMATAAMNGKTFTTVPNIASFGGDYNNAMPYDGTFAAAP
ncbi:MAG: LamG-like jellyroll fold domain-containing protein [Candidatus Roizmanbacteria bacterium]